MAESEKEMPPQSDAVSDMSLNEEIVEACDKESDAAQEIKRKKDTMFLGIALLYTFLLMPGIIAGLALSKISMYGTVLYTWKQPRPSYDPANWKLTVSSPRTKISDHAIAVNGISGSVYLRTCREHVTYSCADRPNSCRRSANDEFCGGNSECKSWNWDACGVDNSEMSNQGCSDPFKKINTWLKINCSLVIVSFTTYFLIFIGLLGGLFLFPEPCLDIYTYWTMSVIKPLLGIFVYIPLAGVVLYYLDNIGLDAESCAGIYDGWSETKAVKDVRLSAALIISFVAVYSIVALIAHMRIRSLSRTVPDS